MPRKRSVRDRAVVPADADLSYIAEDLRPLAVPIADLLALDGNPRRGDVDRIKKSMRRFGQRKPVVARVLDGTGALGEVTAGNHAMKAMQALGHEYVAVVFTDDDRSTGRAWSLADNRASEMGRFDEDALADMLTDYGNDHDLLEDIGWTTSEAAELFSRVQGSNDPVPDSADAFGNDGDEVPDRYREQYGVIVICDTAEDQQHAYERLQEDGYTNLRVVTT